MQIVKIKGCIKSYSWGSRDILPAMFHYEPDGSAQAEAWFGMHHAGPSRLEDGRLLKDYLEEELGQPASSIQPLMLKVLAVNTPLSLHVHPDAVQARAGWAYEEAFRRNGTDLDKLNYRDDNAKSELYYAMTPSTLLCGFRDSDAVKYHLSRLLPVSYDRYFAHSQTVRGIVKTLFTLEGESLKIIIDEFLSSLEKAAEELRRSGIYYTERGISEKVFSLFGYDASVIAPYIMNVVHMRTGEVVFIPSGVLHTYIHGSGIEVENSSDNEIRIGMSGKHRDIIGALNLINFDAGFHGKIELETDSFLRRVAKAPFYSLAVLRSGSYDIREKAPSIALCTEGQARVGTLEDHIILKEGECCFIPSGDDEYHVRVSGCVFQALFPEERD